MDGGGDRHWSSVARVCRARRGHQRLRGRGHALPAHPGVLSRLIPLGRAAVKAPHQPASARACRAALGGTFSPAAQLKSLGAPACQYAAIGGAQCARPVHTCCHWALWQKGGYPSPHCAVCGICCDVGGLPPAVTDTSLCCVIFIAVRTRVGTRGSARLGVHCTRYPLGHRGVGW
jgi:hypothetical protein